MVTALDRITNRTLCVDDDEPNAGSVTFKMVDGPFPEPHSRFILDVACVDKAGGEAAIALDHFVRLAPPQAA